MFVSLLCLAMVADGLLLVIIVFDVGNYKWHNHFGSQGTRIGYCVPFLSLNADSPG